MSTYKFRKIFGNNPPDKPGYCTSNNHSHYYADYDITKKMFPDIYPADADCQHPDSKECNQYPIASVSTGPKSAKKIENSHCDTGSSSRMRIEKTVLSPFFFKNLKAVVSHIRVPARAETLYRMFYEIGELIDSKNTQGDSKQYYHGLSRTHFFPNEPEK